MIIDDLIIAFINVMVSIAAALIEVMMHLGAAMFGATYMAARHDGLVRTGFAILAAGAGYLLFGILRWLLPAFATPGLTPLYSTWGFATVLVLLVTGLFLVTVGAEQAPPANAQDAPVKPATAAPGWLIHLFSYGLAILLLLALVSGGTSTAHRRSLQDRACDALTESVSVDRTNQIAEGLALADRLLDTDLSARLPCQEAEK